MRDALGGVAALLGGMGLAWACAQPYAPTGGDKDTLPPQLLYSIPQQGSTSYQKQEILFVFDEWIAEKNLRRQLILTPTSEPPNPYHIRVRKNKLRLLFEQPLEKHRTYTLNLAGGLTDITERNILESLSLSFSTGESIDSLKLEGQAFWLLTGEAVEGALIQLTENKEDSQHFSQRRATYMTRTQTDGSFLLPYLSEGAYRLWAFLDKNQNRRFDPQSEAHAFAADTLVLLAENKQWQKTWALPMVEQDASPFVFIRGQAQAQHYALSYNKTLQAYRLRVLDTMPRNKLYSQLSEKKRSIMVYKNAYFRSTSDSLQVSILATDTEGNQLQDTVFVRFDARAFETPSKESKKSEQKQKKLFRIQLQTPKESRYYTDSLHVLLYFPRPIQTHLPDSISYLREDSSQYILPAETFLWNHNSTSLSFSFKVPEGAHFNLHIPKNTFIDILGDSSYTLRKEFIKWTSIKYGQLSGRIHTKLKSFILELIDDKGQVVRSTRNSKTFHFSGLRRNTYRFRLIEDINQDGQWNRGVLLLNKPPERAQILAPRLSIRENWILENIQLHLPTDKQ